MKLLKKILFMLALISTHLHAAESPSQQPAETLESVTLPQKPTSLLYHLPHELRIQLLQKLGSGYLADALFWAMKK